MELQPKKFLITGMTPNPGGVEAFIMNLLRNVNTQKVQFDFLVNFEEKIAFEKEILSYGCKIIRLSGRRKHPILHYCRYMHFFHRHAREYDGIYCNLLSLANIDDLLFAHRYGITNIIAHSHNSDDAGPSYMGIRTFLHKCHQKTIPGYARRLFACSDQAGKWMFGTNSSFQIIKNAINTETFIFQPDARERIRLQHGIGASTLVFGSVGRLEIQKNPLFLVDVFFHIKQRLPDSIFLHIGDGSLHEEMKERISALHLENSFLLLGRQEETAAYYSAMDAFLLPSLYEGLSISLVEAQASDVASFLSDTMSNEAILLNDRCISISLTAPASEWAHEIAAHLDAIKSKRRNNYALIAQKGFDIKTEIEKLECILFDEI